MIRFACILASVGVLTGCGRHVSSVAGPTDQIARFVANYTNLQGSFVYSNCGVPSSGSAKQALAKLSTDGLQTPRVTNFSVVEVRALAPQDPFLARRLTNCVAALIDSEMGQKIILLRRYSDDW